MDQQATSDEQIEAVGPAGAVQPGEALDGPSPPRPSRGWAVYAPSGAVSWRSFEGSREGSVGRFVRGGDIELWPELEAAGYRCLEVAFGPVGPFEPTTDMLEVGGMVLFEGGYDLDDFGVEAARDVWTAMESVRVGLPATGDGAGVPDALAYEADVTPEGWRRCGSGATGSDRGTGVGRLGTRRPTPRSPRAARAGDGHGRNVEERGTVAASRGRQRNKVVRHGG